MSAVEFGERLKADEGLDRGLVAIHYQRYDFEARFVAGKRVLDAACGFGYGSYRLAESARHVTGVDISEEAIGYARNRYTREKVVSMIRNIEALPVRRASTDAVCCFEAIEHPDSRESHLRQAIDILQAVSWEKMPKRCLG